MSRKEAATKRGALMITLEDSDLDADFVILYV